jgi:multiple sugar transport system substrate-binding protein
MAHPPHLTRRGLLKGALAPVVAGSVATWPRPARAIQGDTLTLQYWQAYGEYPAIAEMRTRFNEANPGIRVEASVYNDYLELAQALQTAAAGNELPALAGVGYTFIRYVVANVPHLTTEAALAFDGGNANYLASGFAPNILALGQVDGTQHGMPLVIGTPYLIYNASLLTRAGLDRAPQTWAEVREFARVIKAETGQYGLWIQEPADFWAHQALVESNGAPLLVAEPGAQPRTGIAGPEAVAALQLHADMTLRDETAVHLEFRQGEQSFARGQVGMMIASGGSLQTVQSTAAFEIGTAPFPTFGDKPRKVPAGGNNLFIFATDEAQQRAAWEFVKFSTSPEMLTLLSEDTGYIPPRQSLIDDPNHLKPFFDANPLYRAELEQVADTVPWVSWPGPNGLEAEQVLLDLRDRMLSGSQDVPTAASEAAERVNELIQA